MAISAYNTTESLSPYTPAAPYAPTRATNNPAASQHSPYITANTGVFTPTEGVRQPHAGTFRRRDHPPNPLQQFAAQFTPPQRPRAAGLSNIAQLNARMLLLNQYSAAERNIGTGQRLIDAHNARLTEISSVVDMLADLVDAAAAENDPNQRSAIQGEIRVRLSDIDFIGTGTRSPQTRPPTAINTPALYEPSTAHAIPQRETERFELQVGINASNVVEFDLARVDSNILGLADIDVRGADEEQLLEIASRLDAATDFLRSELDHTRALDWLFVGSQSVLTTNLRAIGADDIRHDLSHSRRADNNHERIMLTLLIQRMAFEAGEGG